ncbi:response regulator [Desulfobacterales bacterium HSG2]|nr:response regulator [Desulfobacterales bacterium HSG2]
MKFRILTPIILVWLIVCVCLYYFVLNSVSEFIGDHIRENMARTFRDVYMICDRNLDDIIWNGLPDDEAVRIRKVRTITQIENYLRQSDLLGIICLNQTGEIVWKSDFPENPETIITQIGKDHQAKWLHLNGKNYFFHQADFKPWQWRVILIKKDVDVYSPLLGKVTHAYVVTAVVLFIAVFLMIWLLNQVVGKPIFGIIRSLEYGCAPIYEGITEFEFLSQRIRAMMLSLQEKNKALIASEKKYRSIFENALEGIYQSTPDGRFIDVNPSMARILGYESPDELIRNIRDIGREVYVDPEHRKDILRRLEMHDVVSNYECQHRCKDKTVIWVSIRVRALRNSSGKLIGVEGLIENISERKRAEEALKNANRELEKHVEERTADLRKANIALQRAKESADAVAEAKSRFLANMSHEIRTPMNGVIAAADLAMNEQLSSGTEHYMKIIRSSGYSLLGVINDILDFSKIEAGKLNIETRPFHLNDVLDDVIGMFINRTAEKEVEFLADIDIDTPMALIGDPLRLQQILTNLISNAVKFTKKGGFVSVGVNAPEISPTRVTLKFCVRDNGTGISSEYLGKLFQAFSQADASTTRKYGGSGLGLCICRQLTEMMNGEIWAESEPGKGSAFFFTACFGRQSADKEENFIFPPDIQGLNVLLADKCAESRDIIQKMLDSFGFRVETVSSGRDVLNRIRESRRTRKMLFNLLLMDYIIPDMDGIEASVRIRRDLEETLPIILMKACCQEHEKLDAENAGANALLTKPILPSVLFNAIMDVFGKEALKNAAREKHITTNASIYKKRLSGARILVAEDNLTNQEIALAILRGAGIDVEIVNNGKEAVEAVRKTRFDAVIMDIQMPEMDGYEATMRIRKWEVSCPLSVVRRQSPIPIIAMTAHAMKGDKEKCLKAGMNGYVSKPVNQIKLFHTLCKLLKPTERTGSVRPEEPPDKTEAFPHELPGISIRNALNALNIDIRAFKHILSGFMRHNKDTIREMRNACGREDRELIRELAHSLKGSSGNIGAHALKDTASELEKESMGPCGKETVARLIDNVESALNPVLESLRSFTETPETEPHDKEIVRESAYSEEMLKDLTDALELADPVEIEMHKNILRGHIDSPIFREVEEKIDMYEYDEALEILKKRVS